VTFFDLGKYIENIPITSVSYNKERGTTELMRGDNEKDKMKGR
jgi:hypothetical protein